MTLLLVSVDVKHPVYDIFTNLLIFTNHCGQTYSFLWLTKYTHASDHSVRHVSYHRVQTSPAIIHRRYVGPESPPQLSRFYACRRRDYVATDFASRSDAYFSDAI